MNNDCPIQELWRLFPAGEISAAERETLELHLAGCPDCRSDLAAMFVESAEEPGTFAASDLLVDKAKDLIGKIARNTKNEAAAPGFAPFRKKRIFWQWAFATVVLVCFGFAGFYAFRDRQILPNSDTLRNDSSATNRVKLLLPADGASLSGEQPEFRWARVTNAKTYTLVVSDEKGDIIAQQTTNGESLFLNVSNLVHDKNYFWFVKAKLADGTATDSDTAKFRFVK